ncbi:HK97 family phage prohead protease [Croceifilum oryzae]|uniref:HK97 family phage prohead protease n=1 Tax=Croceifilum oryzae TaxID=1553429 RepID=A0AAJ1TG61_9BACL|nr:HK97 family phage prohead protease [Croceifilum oryzae]MDQ0417914.1 HK97 family phage prohead protease [Croceifilum oryzae]
MKYKSFPVEYKVDESKREIEAYVSIFDHVDAGKDRVKQGAFLKTLQEEHKQPRIKALYQHDPKCPVGRPRVMEEDSTGLFTITPISKTTLGNDLLILAQDGVITETSIGYGTVKEQWDQDEGIRDLMELKLWEYSYVTWGMNDLALVTGVKSLDQLWNYLDVVHECQKEVKAGRMLSEKNRLLVQQAHDALGNLLLQVDDSKNAEDPHLMEVKRLAEEIQLEVDLNNILKEVSR